MIKNGTHSSKNSNARSCGRSTAKKRIVFCSYPDFSDNPRGLFEAIKKNSHYESCWILQDPALIKPLKEAGIASVIKDTSEADDVLAAADIVVSSSFDFSEKKRDGQLYLSTWHGFPLKTIGFLEEQTSSLDGLLMQKILYAKYDMVLASSKIAQLFLGGMFAMDPRKFCVTGYPRNDILLASPGKEILHNLFPEIPHDAKLLFYLPTMRKGLKNEGAQFDNNLFNWPAFDAENLEETLAKHNIYIVVKPHFADNNLVNLKQQKLNHIKVIETETLTAKLLTIYHILNGFDGLITDYSSIYTDFLLLDRPIFFNCPDLELYKEQRGFVTEDPRLLMPGELVKTQEEFAAALKAFAAGRDDYREKRHEVLPIFQHFCDAKSGERTVAALEAYTPNEHFDADKYVANYFVGYHAPLAGYANRMRAELFYSPNQGFLVEMSRRSRIT